jgi:hypothetical protein
VAAAVAVLEPEAVARHNGGDAHSGA